MDAPFPERSSIVNNATSFEMPQSTETRAPRYWRWSDPPTSYAPLRRFPIEELGAEAGVVIQPSRFGNEDAAARLTRIQEVRQQIAEGAYDSERRLEIALDRMIDEVACHAIE
jgi:hypothetical protein